MSTRSLFVLAFLANLAMSLAAWFILPERVAIHFGTGGLPNGWASRDAYALIMLALSALLFLSLYLSPHLLSSMPKRWISLPNRDYWLRDENRPRTLTLFSKLMWEFGCVLFVFLGVVGVLTIYANLSEPIRLDERLFLLSFGAFMLYTLIWVVRMFRRFRVPKQAQGGHY